MSEEARLSEFLQSESRTQNGSEWSESKLEDLLSELLTGARPTGGGLDEGEYTSIGGTQVNSEGYIDLQDLVYIPEDYFRQVEETQLQKHDILVVKDGANTGDVAIAWESDDRIVTNEHLFTLRTDSSINSPYLFYFLLSHQGWKQINGTITGSAQEGINRGFTGKVDIRYPSLSEQRKIATVLYTVDRAIEKTEKLIEQKKRLRDAVAQESLVLETNSYTRPTEWGRIPEGWDERTLEEVCQLITDGTHMPPKRTKHGVPLIGVDEINGIQLDFSGELSYISEKDYQEMSGSNKPNEGDVLVAVVGATIGKSAIVTREEPFVIQRSLGLLRTDEAVLPRFLHTVVQSPNFKRQLDTRSRATAQAGVYLEELKHVRIPVPPIEEQESIASRIDEITHSIRNENKYLSSLKRLKRGLLQDFLSGKIRTTDTNIQVPEEITQHG